MSHVVFIAHLSEVSGAGVALVDTVKAFAGRGFKTTLILPGSGDLVTRAMNHGITPIIIENPEVALTGHSVGKKISLLKKRASYVRHLRRFLVKSGADLAYINTSTTVFPALAARAAGVPIAWHIHETLDSPNRKTRIKKRIIRSLADGLVYASATGMSTLPPPPGTPSLIARNFVDLKSLAPLGHERLAMAIVSRTAPPEVIMNGTFYRKGTDVLLEAANLMDNPPAVIVIGPPSTSLEFAATLDKLANSNKLREKVKFAGLQASLIPFYQRATAFVSASRNEALPIAIVEAMAAGVPVIATNVGDCAEILDHGQCGWVIPPESPEPLANAMNEILANPSLAHKKAKAAYQKVLQDYGAASFWDPLFNFISALIK